MLKTAIAQCLCVLLEKFSFIQFADNIQSVDYSTHTMIEGSVVCILLLCAVLTYPLSIEVIRALLSV